MAAGAGELASTANRAGLPAWSIAGPLAALSILALLEADIDAVSPSILFAVAIPFLFAAIFSAVHHAELIAHRVGQPFGSIILTLAVTVIEVSLIMNLVLSKPAGESAVARDTVFASMMIMLNGIVGLCLLIGGIRYHEQGFQPRAATAALGVLGTLAVLALVLPNFTTSIPGPVYSPAQLVFVAAVSLALYALFLYVQTVSHPKQFLDRHRHGPLAEPPPRRSFIVALFLLPVSLLAVILLAESLAVPLSDVADRAGLAPAIVGLAIALLVLMPEGIASLKAASADRLQTSLNLALGSALASISLTIPAVALMSLVLGRSLVLGLDPEHIVMLVLTLFMSTLTLATGRTTIIQGGIHLVIFGAFLTMSFIP